MNFIIKKFQDFYFRFENWLKKLSRKDDLISEKTRLNIVFITFDLFVDLNDILETLKILIENVIFIPIFFILLLFISPLCILIYVFLIFFWLNYYIMLYYFYKNLNKKTKLNLLIFWEIETLPVFFHKFKNFTYLIETFLYGSKALAYKYFYKIFYLLNSKKTLQKPSFLVYLVIFLIIFPVKFLIKLFTGFSFLILKVSFKITNTIFYLHKNKKDYLNNKSIFNYFFYHLWCRYFISFKNDVYFFQIIFIDKVYFNPFGKYFSDDFVEFLYKMKKITDKSNNSDFFDIKWLMQTKNDLFHFSSIMDIKFNNINLNYNHLYMNRTSKLISIKNSENFNFKTSKNYPGIANKNFDYTTPPYFNKYKPFNLINLSENFKNEINSNYNIKLSFLKSLYLNINNPVPIRYGKNLILENKKITLFDIFSQSRLNEEDESLALFLKINLEFFGLYKNIFQDQDSLEIFNDIVHDLHYDNLNEKFYSKYKEVHELFKLIKD